MNTQVYECISYDDVPQMILGLCYLPEGLKLLHTKHHLEALVRLTPPPEILVQQVILYDD